MPAVVKRTIKPLFPDDVEKVEISIPEAEDLFREIRVANSFVDASGTALALIDGANLNVKLEATASNLVSKLTDHPIQ